ncbi:ArsC/Spx/MgsR family protein, partial [Lactococcus garvieae]|uniref:ArsC/Spx/MgsR family protein n=1 Tax=Lactococcus garvieae TaxID=1363 RepID=UPI00036E6441
TDYNTHICVYFYSIAPTRLSLKKIDQIKHIETSTFNTSVNYILENTNILRSPLIVDQNKLLIGYKAEDIRVFLPSKYREVEIY